MKFYTHIDLPEKMLNIEKFLEVLTEEYKKILHRIYISLPGINERSIIKPNLLQITIRLLNSDESGIRSLIIPESENVNNNTGFLLSKINKLDIKRAEKKRLKSLLVGVK